MPDNSEWVEHLETLLNGALDIWRVDGTVTCNTAECTLRTSKASICVARVTDDGDPYWEVILQDSDVPPLPFGGIQGMLRAVREAVGGDEAGTRLVIGPRADC